MPSSTRVIRRRIRSVANTRKITKAMEMVAASKMRRAVSAVLATRPYAEAAWRAITEMAKVTDPTLHPLLSSRGASTRKLVMLFTSDKGLCGGFNAHMLRKVMSFVAKAGSEIDFVTIGKKGQAAILRSKKRIVASFGDVTAMPGILSVRPIADLAIGDFIRGIYGTVHVAFTDFRSALSQRPDVRQLLPITRFEGLGDVGELAASSAAEHLDLSAERGIGKGHAYLFEPSPEQVLDTMLPRLVEAQIYQAFLESTASEHSARMVAMRSATDAAGDMLDDLKLTYNQARQAGITQEIAEISSGKAALE